ncbi:hypothetical protein BZA70DRAFT_311988 [Myxozyma melibiosi]|uniref:Uncharacterized protein n=1 Tax=Myxozyma melibiosi TaxID=54550 RepID=A0ABR1F1X2_9ASCO
MSSYSRGPEYFQPRNRLSNPTPSAVLRSRTGRKIIIYFLALAVVCIFIYFSFKDTREVQQTERELAERFANSRVYQSGGNAVDPNSPVGDETVEDFPQAEEPVVNKKAVHDSAAVAKDIGEDA